MRPKCKQQQQEEEESAATDCDAAVLAPCWRRGGAAPASALGDARLDEDHVGLELGRPQPPQGLQRSDTAEVRGHGRAVTRR